jgi:hypothetical protein
MGVKYNPFAGNLDIVDSPSGDFTDLDVSGDITLDDGGTYTTTVQVVTPTANRTISFPDATGTVALVAGSTGQVTYNNAGAQAGLTSANIGSTGEIDISLAGAASTPPVSFTGSWFTGGTATTTKPQLLIEPTGTTSTAWSTSGTGLGVNAASGFGGRLLDLQTNGTSRMVVQGDGKLGLGTGSPAAQLSVVPVTNTEAIRVGAAGGISTINGGYVAFTSNAKSFGNASDFQNVLASASIGLGVISPMRSPTSNTVGGVWVASGNATANTTYAWSSMTPALTWDTTGKVGIGTTTSDDKLEIGGAGAGIILASPDGTRYRLTVANGGTLSIAAV